MPLGVREWHIGSAYREIAGERGCFVDGPPSISLGVHRDLQPNYRKDMLYSGSSCDRVSNPRALRQRIFGRVWRGIRVLVPVRPDPGLPVIVEGTCTR